MHRFFFSVVALATFVAVACLAIGSTVAGYALLILVAIALVDHGHEHLWHCWIELHWLVMRVNLINHAICDSHSEIEYYHTAGRYEDAQAEQQMLRRLTDDRQAMVGRIRALDELLQA